MNNRFSQKRHLHPKGELLQRYGVGIFGSVPRVFEHVLLRSEFSKKSIKILICGVLFLLSSCSEDQSDMKRYIDSVKARPAKPVETMLNTVDLPAFAFPQYDTRRSPFDSASSKRKNNLDVANQSGMNISGASLLKELKLVGILTQGSKVWALIQKPDKHISHVTVGDFIDQNVGRILMIKHNAIQFEYIVKKSGRGKTQIITLYLDTKK